MNRRKFLQLAGTLTACHLITARHYINTAQAQGAASPLGDLTQRVLSTRPDALAGWWLLDSGPLIRDLSGHGTDGTAYNCRLGEAGPGDGLASIGFDGATSGVDIFSPRLASLWSGDAGTIIFRAKLYSPAQWNNSIARRCVHMSVDGIDNHNHVSLKKQSYPYWMVCHRWASDVDEQLLWPVPAGSPPGWFFVAYTWGYAAQREAFYLSLDQQSLSCKLTREGYVQPFVGSLEHAWIGRRQNSPSEPWLGWLARVGCWSVALTEAEVANLISIS